MTAERELSEEQGTEATPSAADERYAVRTDGLTRRYDDVVAVDGIDMRVPEGSVYGFLGPNGAGKTTTLRMLTCLLHPSEGTAEVAGASIDDPDAVVQRIGYAPAEPPLYDLLTAREQLEYGARFRGQDLADARERMDRLFDRFDLADDADDRIRTYSRGMKQKVNLMQAVLHDPPLVILDEPTQGLDPNMTRELRTLLSELTADGTSILFSTHVLPIAEDVADRIGVLSNGRLVAEGTPEEITGDATEGADSGLEAAFVDITTER